VNRNICSSKTVINNVKPGKLLQNKVDLLVAEFKNQNLEDFFNKENNIFVTNTENMIDNPSKFYSPELFSIVSKDETILILTDVKISKLSSDKSNIRYKCDFLFLWNEKIWLIKHSFPDLNVFDNIYKILDNPNQ